MRSLIAIAVIAISFGSLPSNGLAQTGEQIGEFIDRGLERVRHTWGEIRQSIDELGVQGRVYGRLRWDKALTETQIDITVEDQEVVVLSGLVKDEETRQKAIKLAEDTVGVAKVIDRLHIDEPRQEPATAPNE